MVAPVNEMTIDGDLTIFGNIVTDTTNGMKIGTTIFQKLAFFGSTPIERPSAYTQTCDSATKTHEAYKSSTLTNNTGIPEANVNCTVAGVNDVTINNNFGELFWAHHRLLADLVNTRCVLNALIDDLQALGLIG